MPASSDEPRLLATARTHDAQFVCGGSGGLEVSTAHCKSLTAIHKVECRVYGPTSPIVKYPAGYFVDP